MKHDRVVVNRTQISVCVCVNVREGGSNKNSRIPSMKFHYCDDALGTTLKYGNNEVTLLIASMFRLGQLHKSAD